MKNKRELSANNGVSIAYKVDVNERIKIPFFNEIMLTLLVVMACVGAIMTCATILSFVVVPGVIISFIAMFSVAFTVLYKLIRKKRALVIAGAAVLAGLIALLFFDDFAKGAVIIFDQSRATISRFMFWDSVTPRYEWQDGYLYLTNAVTVLFSMVLCSAISYFTVVKQSFIAIFLLTFPFFEIGAAFGAVPDYLYFSIMLASWASALTISRVANAKIKMRRSNGEKQKSKIGGSKQKFAGMAVVVAAVVVLLFGGITTYLNAIGFSRAENIDRLRHDTKYAFDNFVDYISGKDRDGSLKEGKLYEVDDRVVKYRHYITMETNISSTEEPIKLRGYTATVYKDNRFEQTDQYEPYQSMFDAFAESSYMMGLDTGRLITSNPQFKGEYFSDITLSDFRRKKPYVYEAYFASLTSDFTSVYDSYAVAPSKSGYTYPAYLFEQYLYMVPDSISYKAADYQAAFAKYIDFVNREYVKSEATESVKALAASFNASNKVEYINVMRSYLEQNLEHTLKSGKCPKNADFVENFLFNTKAGYSTHFASAATVLLQANGYAARYVEGYYIPAESFNNTPSDRVLGYKTIDITDEYAHAWIEIFDETYGWIPVEVTPGYWSEEFTLPQPPQVSDPESGEDDTTASDEIVVPEYEIVDDETEEDLEEQPYQPKERVNFGMIAVIVVAAIVVAFCARQLFFALTKRSIYTSRDVNKKLKFAYKYFILLAMYQNIKAGNVYDHAGLARRMSDTNRHIAADKLNYVFDVFLKHAYSRTPATLEEANEVLSELRAYSRAVYGDLSKPKKLVYRHLRNLYL